MRRTLAVGSIAIFFGASAPAMALSWDYASMSLVLTGDLEDATDSRDLEGYRVDVVKSLGNVAFFRSAFNAYRFDGTAPNRDAATQQVGVGVRFPVTPSLDLWGSVNYERVSLFGEAATGPGIDLGVRARVTPRLDLNLAFKVHGDIDFTGGDADYSGFEVTVGYTVQRGLALLFSLSDHELEFGGSTVEYEAVIGVGARFDF